MPLDHSKIFHLIAFVILVLYSALMAAEPFDYFQNSWALIGLKDYDHGTRITPANELILSQNQLLKFQIGQDLEPLDRRQTKTCLDGWLPVVLLKAQDGALDYNFKFWATPLPTVRNWRRAYNWPTEGENYLNRGDIWKIVWNESIEEKRLERQSDK